MKKAKTINMHVEWLSALLTSNSLFICIVSLYSFYSFVSFIVVCGLVQVPLTSPMKEASFITEVWGALEPVPLLGGSQKTSRKLTRLSREPCHFHPALQTTDARTPQTQRPSTTWSPVDWGHVSARTWWAHRRYLHTNMRGVCVCACMWERKQHMQVLTVTEFSATAAVSIDGANLK